MLTLATLDTYVALALAVILAVVVIVLLAMLGAYILFVVTRAAVIWIAEWRKKPPWKESGFIDSADRKEEE